MAEMMGSNTTQPGVINQENMDGFLNLLNSTAVNTADVIMASNTTPAADTDQENMDVYRDSRNSIIWLFSGPIPFYICLVTVPINLAFLVLLRKSGMSFVVSFLLSAIAIADMVRGVSMFPVFMHTYQNPRDMYVPYRWCQVIHFLSPIAASCHSISIWLTVLLGVFRYISICHPIRAASWCRKAIVVRATLVILALVSPMYVVGRMGYSVVPHEIWRNDINITEIGCYFLERHWSPYYQSVKEVCRVVFIQLVQCISLVVITGKLIFTIWKTDRRRRIMTPQHPEEMSGESRRTTVLLSVVLVMFLLCEIPITLLFIGSLMSRLNGLETVFLSTMMIVLLNDVVLVSGCFNFCVYCLMGRKMRSAVRRYCCCSGDNNTHAV